MELERTARVVSIAYDDPHGGWCVRLRVPNLWREHQSSTVQTEPPVDVRYARFEGKCLELILLDEPGWAMGDEVRLKLKPFRTGIH